MGAFSDAMKQAACDRKEEIDQHAKLVLDFALPQIKRYDGCDKEVLYFIGSVRYHKGGKYEEAIDSLFISGYCYYFALMLKEAFGRGMICNNGRSHIVWLDGTNQNTDVAYDITGVYTDYEVLIPVKAMGETILDFMHVPGLVHNTTDKEVAELINRFKGKPDLGRYV